MPQGSYCKSVSLPRSNHSGWESKYDLGAGTSVCSDQASVIGSAPVEPGRPTPTKALIQLRDRAEGGKAAATQSRGRP
jgi:hypothetical protein